MSSSLQSSEEKRHAHILLCLGLLAGVLVRIISYDFISGDFRESLRPWYAHIAQNGIAAFNTDFSDYNYIYLYCLYIANKFSLSDLAAIKGFSICFDVALLFLSYNMLSLRLSACMSAAGASLVFLLPTVVMNSSKWGQCDSIYSFFMLASIYCLLRRNGSAAFCMLGIGLCFKLQAIFLLPVFGYLVLFERQRRYYNLNFRSLLIIPAIFVLNALPVAIIRKQFIIAAREVRRERF